MKYICVIIALITGACSICRAESLEVTATPVSATAKRGEVVAMNVNLKNILTKRDPVTITATVEWQDEYGTSKTTSADAIITVTQPITINRYKVAIPALFAFVAGSTKVNGQSVISSSTDGLVFELDKTLLESESVTLEYSVKAQ